MTRLIVLLAAAAAVLLAVAATALARPPVVYPLPPPQWATEGTEGTVRLWPAAVEARFTFDGEDPVDGQFIGVSHHVSAGVGGPGGLFGEWGYNTGTRTHSAKFATDAARSPPQSFKVSVYASGGYAWARLMLLGTSTGGACYIHIRAFYEQNSVWADKHSSYVQVYVNGQLTHSYSKYSSGWVQLSFHIPPGPFNVTVWVYAWSYSTFYATNQTVWIDDVKLLPVAPATPTVTVDGARTVATWVNTLPVPVVFSVRFVAHLGGGALVDVWRTATAAPGAAVTLSEPAVEQPIPGSTFAARAHRVVLRSRGAIARAVGFASVWLNAALDEPAGAEKTYSVTWARVWYRVTAPGAAVTVHYADGAAAAVGPVEDAYIADDEPHAWINVTANDGWAKIAAPEPGEEMRVAVPSPQQWVTFFVEDYGYGYRQVRIYTLDGRIVWRDSISPATRTATARLSPYATYIIAVWREGEERGLGPFVVDRTHITINVVPAARPRRDVTTVSAHYNATMKALIIEVFCAAPPCTLEARKGAAVFTFSCGEPFCRVAWITDDPFFTVSVTDTRGARASAFAGTTLTVPPENPFAALADLIVRYTGLEELVGAGRGATFLAVLASLMMFIAISTAKEWEFGMLAFGVGLAVLPPLMGGSFIPVPVGLLIALAALSLIVKKSREP